MGRWEPKFIKTVVHLMGLFTSYFRIAAHGISFFEKWFFGSIPYFLSQRGEIALQHGLLGLTVCKRNSKLA